MTDSLIKYDFSLNGRKFAYSTRAYIFNILGREEESFEAKEKGILLLPKKDTHRLFFMICKYIKKKNIDSTDFYISEMLKECDNTLKFVYSDFLSAEKSKIIYICDGKDAAVEYLSNLIDKYPDDNIWVYGQRSEFTGLHTVYNEDGTVLREEAESDTSKKVFFQDLRTMYMNLQNTYSRMKEK